MAKFEWSETFISIEGEGPHSGKSTAYVRFARCNFKCKGFNNPNNEFDKKGYAVLNFNPKDISSLGDIEPIEKGCDSQYAVNPDFAHIWHKGDENKLADEIMSVVPHGQWKHPQSGRHTILSLTGGEPTLRAKTIPILLATEQLADLRHILIETNCAVPLKKSFLYDLNEWVFGHPDGKNRFITWSNSPKLVASGELFEEAIRPEIAMMQRKIINNLSSRFEQYFKFVCGPNQRDFDEVRQAMDMYYAAGVPRDAEIYIMPTSCTEEQQMEIAADVADMCIDQGFIYCHRVHNSVYANAIGK